ncbi:MAG: Hpt domain-containing protein [Spirochaetota bacterium]
MNEKAPINIREAKVIVDGDLPFFEELLGYFVENSFKQVAEIKTAISNKNSQSVRFFAHQIKSSLKSIGAEKAVETAYRLEQLGMDARLEEAGAVLLQFERQLQEIQEYYKKGDWKKEFTDI